MIPNRWDPTHRVCLSHGSSLVKRLKCGKRYAEWSRSVKGLLLSRIDDWGNVDRLVAMVCARDSTAGAEDLVEAGPPHLRGDRSAIVNYLFGSRCAHIAELRC